MGKTILATQSHESFSIQILVNFDIFQTAMKDFLKYYLAQISFLIHDRQFEPLNA